MRLGLLTPINKRGQRAACILPPHLNNDNMNTMYRIKMTRMTSGEVVYDKEISGYTRAYNLFNEMCDERSYEVKEDPMEGTYYGGGHGHDFMIELSVDDEDSDDTQYQPF